MAGPAIRSYKLAIELSRDADVTLVVPYPTDIDPAGLEIVEDDPWEERRMSARVRGYDAVVAQCLPVATMRSLAKSDTIAIYDLYAPWLIEALPLAAHLPRTRGLDTIDRLTRLEQTVALMCGDAFICASDRQRDLWLGAMLAVGRIDDRAYRHDPSLQSLVDCRAVRDRPGAAPGGEPVMRGVVPGIGRDDRVVLWGGGVWNWFDPLTVIRAVHRLSHEQPDVRLFFLGLRHPNPAVPEMAMTQRAVDLARDIGARDRTVFFNFGWVPFEQRGAVLPRGRRRYLGPLRRPGDAVCVPDAPPRLLLVRAPRGVHPRGRARGGGRQSLASGASSAWKPSTSGSTHSPRFSAIQASARAIADRFEAVRDELAWPRVVEPLRRLIACGGLPPPGLPRVTGAEYVAARLENALLQHGIRGAAARVVERTTGRTRPLQERVKPPLR